MTAFEAARKVGREILVEIIASKAGPLDDDTIARALTELYDAGLKPDWWKLEPQASAKAWQAIDGVIAAARPAVPRRGAVGPGGADRKAERVLRRGALGRTGARISRSGGPFSPRPPIAG